MEGMELRNWREKHNLTQLELAQHLNVKRETVTRWEIGMRKIPPFLFLALDSVARNLKKEGGEQRYGMRKKKKRKVGN